MPIQSNLSVSPYFDDYDYDSDYYRILFKPATAVQVRELNQLQTILQRQIEEFGDTILQRGTLLDGCQATFSTSVPYAKILDETADGAAANVLNYVGLFARGETNGVTALVVDSINGFEAQDPDLKTLYLRYLDGGANSNIGTFVPSETLEIYNTDRRLYDVNIVNGSQNFSNADNIVILSAIEVQNTTGGTTFSNGSIQAGENIVDPVSNATVEIISVDTSSNTNAVTLRVKPLSDQLALANTTSWTFSNNSSVSTSNTSNDLIITRVIGSGATATLLTTQNGTIDSISLANGGSGYTILPHVTVSTTTASSSDIDTLNLAAENYLAKVIVADPADEGISGNTVGVGYAMSITEGKIYQKGQFLRVAPQSLVVSKYSNTQSDVAIGFETIETVANASIDTSLNDNAAGYLNENAPGADRLKLVPRLVKKTFAEADNDPQFFSIYKFSEGQPYSQRTAPEFNKVADELARRTFEESGNYVLNPFEITTRSTLSIANSDTTFTYLIDPGLAYINGYRVETVRNFAKNVDKSRTVTSVANSSLDLIYGNYVRCNEFVGLHNFSTAQLVELHGTAGDAISGSAGTFTDPADQIGTARIRSIIHESGIQGTSDAVYRIYLFDIRMDTGRNFKNVKSIYSTDGIADPVLEPNPYVDGEFIAVLKENTRNSLIFNTTRPIESLANVKYRYRTSKEAAVIAANGVIQVANNNGAEWPYSGALSTTEKNEVIILPENNLIANSNLSGTISASNTDITGANTAFASELEVGDYIIANGNTDLIAQITSIKDNDEATYIPEGQLSTVSGGTIAKVYPKDVPIPLASRSGMSASIVGTDLIVDTDITLDVANTVTVVYNQRINGATSVAKPARRTSYVKIQANTHPDTVNGPWCLGIPDVFRLRAVYAGSTTSDTEITDEFYIDHNQNENYYDLSYLYKRQDSSYSIGADDVILVEFDCFERASDGGLLSVESYTIDDETALGSLTTSINTLEIPEVITKDRYHDLREVFDFRPTVLATATITSTPASADTNPSESDYANSLFSASDIKFPVPESDLFFDMDYYNSRVDTIIVNSDGEFEFGINRDIRSFEANQFPLYRVNVPAYPSLPVNLSSSMQEILDRKIASGSLTNQRRDRFTIRTETIRDQVQGYTMKEIGALERRIEVLEYYANLSEVENRVKELSIPSSVDETIERFKFGFYVDNFSSYQYSDISNPEFDSTVFEYVLQPASGDYSLPLQVAKGSQQLLTGNKIRFPYTRKNLLSQRFATSGPREVAPPPVPQPSWTTICQNVTNRNKNFTQTDTPAQYAAVDNNVWSGVTEESIFTLTSNTAANGQSITLDFSLYYGTDRIIIQQATSPSGTYTTVFSTDTNYDQVQTLTDSERRELRNLNIPTSALPYPEDWLSPDFDDPNNTANDPNYSSSITAGFLKFIGTFSFAYDSSKGRYLKVIVQKASPDFLYRICYPGDSLVDPVYRTIGPTEKKLLLDRFKPIVVGPFEPPPLPVQKPPAPDWPPVEEVQEPVTEPIISNEPVENPLIDLFKMPYLDMK